MWRHAARIPGFITSTEHSIYKCIFTAFADSDEPVSFTRSAAAKNENQINCVVPMLPAEQQYEAKYKISLKIVEGASMDVPYLGEDEPQFAMTSAGELVC